jgi:hypothetical protein
VARPSGSIGLTWGFASVPDRAKANSAIMRCRTRVVPLRTVNESLNGDAMRERGLGEGDLAIAAFHKERRIAARFGNVGHNDGEFCVTLCFADAADADAFQRRFGGTRIVRGTRDAMQYLPGAEAR